MKEKKKKHQTTPQQIRRKIISLVQRFQELSKEISFISPAGCKLKNITGSKTLRIIRAKTHLICGKWGKDYQDVETMLKVAESLRKSYVNLIFRTDFIRDPNIQRKLDVIPLELAKLIAQ